MSRLCGAATSDRVNVNGTVLNGLDPYTVGMWIYDLNGTNPRRMIHKGAASGNSRRLALRTTATAGLVNVTIDRATTDLSYTTGTTTGQYALGTWTFIAVSFRSANAAGDLVRIYTGAVNSAMVQCSLASANDGSGALQSDGTTDLILGNDATNLAAFDGRIAQVSLWSSELTLAQIDRLRTSTFHAALASEFSATCVGYWRLAQPESAEDYSGNGNNGTITGATADVDPPLLAMRERARRGRTRGLVRGLAA